MGTGFYGSTVSTQSTEGTHKTPYDIYQRQTTDLINQLYETGQETYRIPRNNAK